MSNQQDIAKMVGVTQAAVSKALRGDPSISEPTRQRILAAAESLGYRPNAYVSTLMACIRAGRPPSDRGCIGLLMNSSAEDVSKMMAAERPRSQSAYRVETYKEQYLGIANRAASLGFYVENFYLQTPGMTSSRLDKIFQTRGITGLILFPAQGVNAFAIELDWSRYAVSTIAYTWSLSLVNRVTTHHRHNVELAFHKLVERGYQKIGMCLPPEAVEGVDSGWKSGFLLIQDHLPQKQRIPLFVGKPGQTPPEKFETWLRKWKLDALICLVGHELVWLERLNLKVPSDMGVACLNRPPDSHFSGIKENHEMIGACTVDLVVAQIHRNEYGLPEHPKLILINGDWVEGETICPMK